MDTTMQTMDFSPTVIKDVLLLSPGRWNNVDYTELEIQKAFNSTDWNDKKNRMLYLDHQDTKERGVANFGGFVQNVRLLGSSMFGDLEVWNPMVAMWLGKAKAKFGISATLAGRENRQLQRMEDFHFQSFSVVTDPACKPAMINLSANQEGDVQTVIMLNETKEELESVKHKERREAIESVPDKKDFDSVLKEMLVDEKKAPEDYENLKSLTDNEEVKKQIDGIIADERKHHSILEEIETKRSNKELSLNPGELDTLSNEELAKISGFEAERKKRGMSPGEFYAVPRDPPSSSSLPIFDAAHVRNAIARFNQTQLSPQEKASAWRKIKSAASKFGVEVKKENCDEKELMEREMGAIYDRQVQHIKDSLKYSHPEWSDKKIEQVAYATANKMKKEDEKKNAEKIDPAQKSLSESPARGTEAEAVKQLMCDKTHRENSDTTLLKGGLKMPEIENKSEVVATLSEVKTEVQTEELKKEEPKESKKEEPKEEPKKEPKKEEPEKKSEELSSEAIMNKVKEMSAEELVKYTNFVREYLSAHVNASASEVTLAYMKSKEDKGKKELSANELLASIDARIASLKELDSSKKMQEMEAKIQELSAKVKAPDRKTLSVAFDGNSDSNVGMLSFLQHRMN